MQQARFSSRNRQALSESRSWTWSEWDWPKRGAIEAFSEIPNEWSARYISRYQVRSLAWGRLRTSMVPSASIFSATFSSLTSADVSSSVPASEYRTQDKLVDLEATVAEIMAAATNSDVGPSTTMQASVFVVNS